MKIREGKTWSITGISPSEMEVIVSMIRMEVGSGAWDKGPGTAISDEQASIAERLLELVNDAW